MLSHMMRMSACIFVCQVAEVRGELKLCWDRCLLQLHTCLAPTKRVCMPCIRFAAVAGCLSVFAFSLLSMGTWE